MIPYSDYHQSAKDWIDVWKITVGDQYCYVANEQDAIDIKGSDSEAVITKEKMRQEVFEKLPIFSGF